MSRRRSEVSNKTNNQTDFNLSLFEHALKDPASKNLILQLLSANQKNVFELFKAAGSPLNNTPVKRVKRKEHCESPTALLRRRELEKINRPESAQSHTSEQSSHSSTSGRSSTVPFERILKNVIAYVEINSNGTDRSGGAKALLKSMGAAVSEKFTRDVTHVIFKDGLYTTYQRAKLLKVHLVSVLWLEATRRNGVRAQEKNYPALGTKNYDLNVSLICSQMQKDYEDVIRDEIRRTLESGTSLPSTKSLMESRRKTIGSSSKSFNSSSQLGSQSIKNDEVHNIFSKIRAKYTPKKSKPSSMILHDESPVVSTDEDLSRISNKIQCDLQESSSDTYRPSSLNLNQNEESDSASECGMINGDFSQKETVIDETINRITPLQSNEVFTSFNMEITCMNESDSNSTPVNKNRTSNSTTSMELTSSSGDCVLQNMRESLLNSISYVSSRNQNSSLKKNDNEKENFSTPKTIKLKSVRSKSTIKRKNVEKDVFSTSTINENATSEDDFYNLKTPKLTVSECKLLKPVNILEINEKEEENVSDEKNENENGTVRVSLGNSKNTTDSSMYISLPINKKLSTSMSSLRLSKSSLENSNSTNMPNLRISPEKQNSEKIDEDTELNVTQQKENQNASDQIEPLLSTPFVTERKKRNNRRTMRMESTNSPNSCLQELEASSETPVKNTRKSKRISSVPNGEKQIFVEQLENINTSLNKNKESEMASSGERRGGTPRPARKYASKTPAKSDILDSPFVNTRPRRKSVRAVQEKKEDCNSISAIGSPAASTRRSSRISGIKSTSTPKKMESQECVSAKVLSESHNNEELEEEKSVSATKELSNIIEEEESSDLNHSTSLKPVVFLQDVLVTKEVTKDSKTTRGTTLSQPDKCVVSMASTSVTNKKSRISRRTKSVVIVETEKLVSDIEDNDTDEVKKERRCRQTKRMPSGNNVEKDQDISINKRKKGGSDSRDEKIHTIISRSKSESDICDTTKTRKSKRIRKLYDPTLIESEEKIQESLGVNDQAERETIRQEKVLKVNAVSQNKWLSGNVLMSQKAMDFLEKSSANQDNTTVLFKKPESVLEELGIDRGKKNMKKKSSIMNNSGDEQVELAEEFVNKKKMRSSLEENEAIQKTPRSRKTMRNFTQKALTTGNSKRRSTMDFVPKPLITPKARTKLNLDQKPTIVCTKMHKTDVQMFNQIVKKLGRFEIEDEVSGRTTHLVVGEAKRTVNMLRALSRGCWILKQEWLLTSLEEGRWVQEEEYEATEFSPNVQECRLRRQAFGPSFNMNIFLDCGVIYVAKSTIPRCSDLRELIALCMGKVTKIPDNAQIAVGAYFKDCDCVNELWVLDSITTGKLRPLEEYTITSEVAKTKSPFV